MNHARSYTKVCKINLLVFAPLLKPHKNVLPHVVRDKPAILIFYPALGCI